MKFGPKGPERKHKLNAAQSEPTEKHSIQFDQPIRNADGSMETEESRWAEIGCSVCFHLTFHLHSPAGRTLIGEAHYVMWPHIDPHSAHTVLRIAHLCSLPQIVHLCCLPQIGPPCSLPQIAPLCFLPQIGPLYSLPQNAPV